MRATGAQEPTDIYPLGQNIDKKKKERNCGPSTSLQRNITKQKTGNCLLLLLPHEAHRKANKKSFEILEKIYKQQKEIKKILKS